MTLAVGGDAKGAPRGRLARRYMLVVGLAGIGFALLIGLVEATFGWREEVQRSRVAQHEVAQGIARAIDERLDRTQRLVRATADLPWSHSNWLGLDAWREELHRLLLLQPILRDLAVVDAIGKTTLRVSRRDTDARTELGQTDSGLGTVATGKTHYGELQYLDGYEPTVSLTTPVRGGGTVVSTIALRMLAAELTNELAPAAMEVAVLDSLGRLVLHRNPEALLQSHVVDGHRVPALAVGGVRVVERLQGPEWTVVVRQPTSEALKPVWRRLARTALIVLATVLTAAAAAWHLARALMKPIEALRQGAQRLAEGKLETRIDIRTNDELEDLAAQFNRMAERLQESVETLEQKVTERTAALLAASQHKDNFLAEMSHELRTPLNSILGFADVLREGMAGPLNDEQHEYLGDIHTSGRHLLSLIEDLLDIAKIPAGKLVLSLVPVDVGQPVQGAIASTRGECLRKTVQLTVGRAGTAPATIVADERRVRQILINLIGNAIKFTPEGGHVAVRIAGSARYPGGLRLEVEDHGIGIAADDLERIWEPFVQGVQSPHSATKGAGLGLALVRLLTELHGGTASVSSVPGQGATFAVDLPAEAPPQVTIQTEGTRT